jgi:3-hydroxyacyl-[acyl-carrier-protein] dehydratase
MLDHAALRAILPHRHPMLLLDRVTSLQPGRSITAEKSVSGSEPCYQHARSYAFPTSLLIESMGQAAAVLWLSGAGGVPAGQVLMLTLIRDFHVAHAAFPGDVLRHEVWLDHVSDGSAIAAGETWVGARRIATAGSLLAVVRPSTVTEST